MDQIFVVKSIDLDWSWLTRQLQQLKLLDFAKVCLTLCEKWFDTTLPMTTDISPDFYEQATQKVFANGVFGFNDAANRENGNLNVLQRYGKFRAIVGRIFPSYKNVYYVPHYSFVQGKTWLLPVVWIYRPIRGILKGKSTDAVKLIDSALRSDDKLAERKGMLAQWGLDFDSSNQAK